MKQLFGFKQKQASPTAAPANKQTPAKAETPQGNAETATKTDQSKTSPNKSTTAGDKHDNKYAPKVAQLTSEQPNETVKPTILNSSEDDNNDEWYKANDLPSP